MFSFGSNIFVLIIVLFHLDQVLNAKAFNDDDDYSGRYYYRKGEVQSKLRNVPESIQSGKGKGIMGKFSKYKEAMSKRGFFNEAEFEEAKTESSPKAALVEKTLKLPPKLPPKLTPKVAPVKQNETEAEKAERIHRTFEKLLTFVEIVGQVDNYVSTKWKNLVKTVSNLYEEEEDEDYRLGLNKYKGCPVFLKET